MASSNDATIPQAVRELVELRQSASQDAGLEKCFQEFYQLEGSPRIARKFILEKAEFNRFMKARTKQRTQFEAVPDKIDLTFDSFRTPFEYVATWTEFLMPSGKSCQLYEALDAPNGLTESVSVTFGDEKLTFPSYFQAEGYALAKYLEEIRK